MAFALRNPLSTPSREVQREIERYFFLQRALRFTDVRPIESTEPFGFGRYREERS